MTSTLDPTPAPVSEPSRRSAGHIIAIIIGCLMLLPALGLAAGGGALAVAQGVATDDGYYHVQLDRVESDGVAVATTDLWDDEYDGEDWPWILDFLDLDLRVRAEGAASTDEVFVAIARSADVDQYFSDVRYSDVVELNDRRPRYREATGGTIIESPVEQDFWTVSSVGSGEQEIAWEARSGRWSIVVMNADGSPVVAADVELGARSGAVTPIAITLLIAGSMLLLIAIILIVIGVRGGRPGGRPTPSPEDQLFTGPLPPPEPASAVQVDDVTRDPTPVP